MIEAKIVQDWNGVGEKLYIFEHVGNRTKFFIFNNGMIEIVEKNIDGSVINDDEIKPIRLNCGIGKEIIKAFINLAKDQDIKSNKESKIEGLYEATTKHLEDMRKLVFNESNNRKDH
jgi:hypothetical protein